MSGWRCSAKLSGVIRQLWQGGQQSHRGAYYTVEDARLYTLPEVLPAIAVAAAGPEAAEVAARCGDALIATSPDATLSMRIDRLAEAESAMAR